MPASRETRALATTTHCAEPTTGSRLAGLVCESTTAPTTRFSIWSGIKTGSESIEATLRRRWVFFAGFVARMEDMRLSKCLMFGGLVGDADCIGGQEKQCMRCFLGDFRALGINASHWTTAAQDEGGMAQDGGTKGPNIS